MLRPSVRKPGQSHGRLIVSDLLGLFSVMRDLHEDTVDVLLVDTFPGQTKVPPEVAENFAVFHAAGGEVRLLSSIWEDSAMHAYLASSHGLLCPGTLVPPLHPLTASASTLSTCMYAMGAYLRMCVLAYTFYDIHRSLDSWAVDLTAPTNWAEWMQRPVL